MKIIIVDDNPRASERIRGMLSAQKDMVFLEVPDPQLANRIVEFGVEIDVALIDLRFANTNSQFGDSEGFTVCQKIRTAMPNVVIVGYSSSFSLENEENRQMKKRFLSMGADIVCALEDLTLTPASELRFKFQSVRDQREKGGNGKVRQKIFIGSSTEGLDVADHIQAGLSPYFEAVMWKTAFGLGEVTIEALERAIREFQFAIFVFTPDDQLESRGTTTSVARDNVIFEAGLFIGSLGRSRTFVVRQDGDGIRLPSDLAGLNVAIYPSDSRDLSTALGPACLKIREAIHRILNKNL
jgi:predicted nucleotide-binding protein